MAIRAIRGFEGGAIGVDDITFFSGTASYDTGTVRTGARSIRCNPASGVAGYMTFTNPARGFEHFALRIATLPSLARVICGQLNNGSNVKLNSDGTLEVFDGATSRGSSSALSTNTWYWIGWRSSAGTSVDLLQVDGVTVVTGTVADSGNGQLIGFSGTEASAVDAYIDDYILDDAAFLAPSKVDIALPISDNTRTNVTGGAGGTTNLWDAVNNTPPAGVASASETNTTNIEFPASLTESYIANLETYTTLGIASGDTVIATRGIIRHGEDIATGTKNGTYVGTTNPTQTDNTAFTFGNDGGAHGAETGLWVTLNGTIVASPSVTLGTSPTIQVDRASQTRVGCIDFMGMLVAWTPAAAADRVPYSTSMPQLVAQ
jgi:hypothetical protein